MAETLSTVVVAAWTSGTVTLGIEWVFKPRLEARKERLLELHRKRRTFESQMVTVMINVAKWSDVNLSNERPDAATRLLAQDRDAAEQQIDTAIAAMNSEAYEIAAHYMEPIRSLVIRYIFNARIVQLSERSQGDKWTLLLELTKDAHAWLFSRVWRVRTRGRAMVRLRRALDDLETAKPGSR